MKLLESFMVPRALGFTPKQTPRFSAGCLTIVDLTDPFIDPGSACGLFEIVTRLFVRAEVRTGKVLVVDEAHKVKALHTLKHIVTVLTSTKVPFRQRKL